jgi:hypothetical protein
MISVHMHDVIIGDGATLTLQILGGGSLEVLPSVFSHLKTSGGSQTKDYLSRMSTAMMTKTRIISLIQAAN